MDLFRVLNHANVNDELILAEVSDIISQLVTAYQTTDYLPDRQYIFCELKEVIQISAEQNLHQIHAIAFKAMLEITAS